MFGEKMPDPGQRCQKVAKFKGVRSHPEVKSVLVCGFFCRCDTLFGKVSCAFQLGRHKGEGKVCRIWSGCRAASLSRSSCPKCPAD